jgi:pantoate--beta-alanine ligase
MEVVKKTDAIRDIVTGLKKGGGTIGFVPTMGYLHKGHTSLMKQAKRECGRVIVSIFINPIQFGQDEDFERYPRDFESDHNLSKQAGVDYVFYPDREEMYGKNFETFVEVRKLSRIMCGKARPGHFKGVCTVVLKLFSIINPDKAYFGEKDYQQLVIIKKMTEDLNLPVKIVGCPIIRGNDGLALSSRNKYLSKEERENAIILYQSLKFAEELINKGEREVKKIKNIAIEKLMANPAITAIDYFDFRDPLTLEDFKELGKIGSDKKLKKVLIATAVWIGKTRLIDNIVVDYG